MALVMLPCDLPWWPQVQRQLTQLALARSSREVIETMEKIHSMCNISLDPEEETSDPALFQALERFLEDDLTPEERRHFLEKTSPAMAQRALQLKSLKPPGGLHFSLQQQSDQVQLDRSFVASLLAHAFFSTFPKRTPKTHPTLQDFNFSSFFKHLDMQCQKAKLRSILHYFDQLENEGLPEQKVVFSRQVMYSKDWLTIEDWLECGLPLVPLLVRHEGRIDRAEPDSLHVCFSSSHLGGDVLSDGSSQECLQFCTQPELLTMLSCVEALEDNEILAVDGVMQVSRISGPRHRATMDPLPKPPLLSICCMDAEMYTRIPIGQLEEDNVLRELNKALLGFRQKCNPSTPTLDLSPNSPTSANGATTTSTNTLEQQKSKRLSPIGESFSSTPPEKTPPPPAPAASRKEPNLLQPPAPAGAVAGGGGGGLSVLGPGGRRGRFIVLGSSGECLPVSRTHACSLYSSCQSESDDEFHSARTSLEHDDSEGEDAGAARRYSAQLDTPERRSTFAARLRDALCRGTGASVSVDVHDTASDESSDDSSSYAVGITVAGADLQDGHIRVRRGGSRGFMLQEESMDALLERQHRRGERRAGAGARGTSSCYSFSTEISSELEELCDQYNRWLGDMDLEAGTDPERELNARDIAVVRFASSLLKRTLSDSFAGASLLTPSSPPPMLPLGGGGDADSANPRGGARLAAVARSLSLELARHNHRLAAQLVSLLGAGPGCGRGGGGTATGLRAVATGNWGCGARGAGDPQLKLVVQWLAASVAGVPALAYYTCGHSRLLKLDTVARVLLDRRWTVGELVAATLHHAQDTLQATAAGSVLPGCLFDGLLGMEKPSPAPTLPSTTL